MNRRKINNKSGFSLAEISLAVLIFALCAIPLYYAISYGSAEEIQLEKMTIANKLLESFRDEMKNIDFDLAKKDYLTINENSLPPETFNVYLDAAKKYKDFKFVSDSKVNDLNGIESINFKVGVSWTTNSGRIASQSISFVKVK